VKVDMIIENQSLTTGGLFTIILIFPLPR